MLNYPNNPTGAVCGADRLRALAAVMRRFPQVWIMSDDMYEHLIHDGTRNATLAAEAPDLAGRVLTISGVSKTYAMTGWRVGFAGGPARLIGAMAKIQGQSTGGVSPMAQAAAQAALDGPQESVCAMRETYAARSRLMVSAVNGVPGLTCKAPAGAFYLFVNVGSLIGRTSAGGVRIADDAAFCSALLEEAGVATVHGAAFGSSPYMRMSTASDDASLKSACDRLTTFCASMV